MNFKTTIILLALLVVVGAICFLTRPNPTKEPGQTADQTADQTTGAEGPKVMDVDSGKVKRITIVAADGSRTVVEKNDQTWALTEPVKSAAVDWQTQDLIRALCDLRSQGRPASAPADSGLNKPTYTVDISTTDGKTTHLVIGDKNGIGDAMYAQVDGGDVNLVDSSLAKTLKTAAVDLRDKHLLKAQTDARQIRITAGNQRLVLVRDGDKWNITEPVKLPGDSDAVSSLLSTITGTEASEFLQSGSEELAFADFDHPTMKVWLSAEPPTTQATTIPAEVGGQSLTIGAPDSLAKGHYFVETSDGLIGKVDKSILENLTKKPLDLRDKDAAMILPADVNRISIVKESYSTPPATRPGQAAATTRPTSTQLVVLQRRPKMAPVMGPPLPTSNPATAPTTQAEQTVWMFTEPADAKSTVDDLKVDALLAKFNPLRADKYLEKVPDGSWQQRYVISLESKTSVVHHLEVIRPVNGQTPYAIYDDLTFEVPAAFTDALDADFHKTAP